MERIIQEINSRVFSLVFWVFGLGAQLHQEMNAGRILIAFGMAVGCFACVLNLTRYEDKLIKASWQNAPNWRNWL